MKKTILQAVLFSVIVHVLIIGFQLVKGYVLTKSYKPSIINSYENVNILQNEVAFGVIYNSNGILFLVLSFFVGVVCFTVGKFLFVREK